ncbi:MAG: hypothetical protein ACOY3Y_17530, partial [Acidobacteriota bacterium]
DIFAFGCVLYEMLAGRRAFDKGSKIETLSAILYEDPAPLEASGRLIPPGVIAVAHRCLEKRADDRFQSARDVALAFEMLTPRTGAVAVASASGRARRFPWLMPAGAIAVLVAALAGVRVLSTRDALPSFEPHQVTSRPGVESEPAISPTGREIAYVSSEGGSSDIWITDVRGGRPLRLSDAPSAETSPCWLPDGAAVAFVSDRGGRPGIWKAARFGGDAVMLVDDATDPAVSPDGTLLAFARANGAGFTRIGVVALDEPEKARILTGESGGLWNHRNPAFSPDGRMICYEDQRDLWLVGASGGTPRRLTHDDANDGDAAWSPDGRHVYFTSTREGPGAVWRVPARGGRPQRVTLGTGPESVPTVSADGRWLAYATSSGEQAVVLADTRSGRRVRLAEGPTTTSPRFARDARSILFVSDLDGGYDVWRAPIPGAAGSGAPVRVTEHRGACNHPVLSPDGAWIAYFRVVEGQRDIWVTPASGGVATNVTAHPATDVQPEWSPDGRRLAFVSDRTGGYQVWVANFEAGQPMREARQLSRVAGVAASPAWSPDGSEIAFVEWSDAGREVWLVSTDGTGRGRQLTRGAGARFVVWPRETGRLVVAGDWGGEALTLREVSPSSGEVRRPTALESITLSGSSPEFDVSPDGTLLAVIEEQTRGDIWALEARRWRF